MSVTVRLAELLDMAFGSAQGSSPQAGALRILLRGLLQHLSPQEAAAQAGEGERALLEPGAGLAGGQPGSQRCPGLGGAEGQPPGAAELPAAGAQQVEQLRKRVEGTEEGMAKVTDMLQEMLTTICSLKTTVEGFQEELQLLKDNFQKAGLEELREQALRQDEQGHLLQSILGQLAEVQRELSSLPCNATTLRQSSLHGVSTGEKLSGQGLSTEPWQEPAHEGSCRLSWLLEQSEAVGTHISHHKSQLQQHADSGTSEDTAARLEKVPTEMRHPQDGGQKGLDFGREVLDQVGQLQEQCARLQEAAERLWGDNKDTQKADKASLETKASQEELQHAMVQLSEVMQDLLQRMSLMDQDRQKGLEKLLSKMDSKLDSAVLAPLQTQLEQMLKVTQQCLCQGTCCGATHAAGFKRQLCDPARCISCDRPLPAAPAPLLVTVRKPSQLLQPHRACADGSNRPAQRLLRRESQGSCRASRDPLSPTGPLSTSSSLITVCPCGNPVDFTCDDREVDILGINGVIYKGRLNSPGANRTTTVGRDLPATKTSQPRSQHAAEKMRRVPKYGSHYVSPYSCAATRRPSSQGGQWQAATGGSRTVGT